jgi:phage gpG-like protein
MAGTSITIVDTATPAVSRLIAAATQPAEMMRDIAGYLLFSTQRRFETETGPDGKKWQGLALRRCRRKS